MTVSVPVCVATTTLDSLRIVALRTDNLSMTLASHVILKYRGTIVKVEDTKRTLADAGLFDVDVIVAVFRLFFLYFPD